MPGVSILGGDLSFDAGVFIDRVSNQITAAAAPSIGNLTAIVMNDAGADEGVYGSFVVPDNYGSAPTLRITAVLDGAPGANDIVAFSFRKRTVTDNGAADGTFDAAQTASVTVGSAGGNYSDEDLLVLSITLTAAQYSAGATVFFYLYVNAATTTYAGNLLLFDAEFRYTAA